MASLRPLAVAALLGAVGLVAQTFGGFVQRCAGLRCRPISRPGAQIAVVSGDPTTTGMTTIELIMPDGYRMPPHSHPVDEHVQVLVGALLIGLGDKLDAGHTIARRSATPARRPPGRTTTRSQRA